MATKPMRTKKTYAEMKEHLDLLREKRKAKALAKGPPKHSRKPLVTFKPMKKVSTKQAKRLANYSVTKPIYMAAHPNCERCGARSEHLHHKMARGIHLDNPEFYCALCANCHEEVEANKNQARIDGWILYK